MYGDDVIEELAGKGTDEACELSFRRVARCFHQLLDLILLELQVLLQIIHDCAGMMCLC